MAIRLKVLHNKRNNQLSVYLSKRKLMLKKKIPKFIEIDNIRMGF